MIDAKVNISVRSVINLLNQFTGFPKPDDPGEPGNPWGPYGPGTPVIRDIYFWLYHHNYLVPPKPGPEPWNQLALGPVPDPWKMGPSPIPWKFGPHPQPWLFASMTRAAIQGVVSQHDLAAVIAGTEHSADSTKVCANRISAMAERICGNEVRDIYIPVPPKGWPGGDDEPRPIHPVEIIAAGVQFEQAASGLHNHALQIHFARAAEKLMGVGLARLDSPM